MHLEKYTLLKFSSVGRSSSYLSDTSKDEPEDISYVYR
jgi:hypothetical protein